MSEEPKKEEAQQQKEECPQEGCFGFHGFGPRCHWKGPGMHGHHHHKERKCECGEVIPKRKEGEPKIKVCPKCGKDLPKKEHGFGMRCHKMKKWMKFMHMMQMMNGGFGGPEGFGFGFGPRHHRFGPTPPPPRGLEVHHYIHFGPPRPPMGPPFFGRPPMFPSMFPPMGHGFGRHHHHMGPPPEFDRPPMGPPEFDRPPMGPMFPPFGFGHHHGPHGPHGPHGFFGPFGPFGPHHGPHGPHGPCEKKEDEKKE